MLSRVTTCVSKRNYGSVTQSTILSASELFTEGRRLRLNEKVSKMKKFAPSKRVVNEENVDPSKRASVLVPLVSINNEPGLMFTLRSVGLRSHGGEISFPGGKFDVLHDKNAQDTALRETDEELGIPRNQFDIWAQLPSLQGRDGKSVVTPIIALLKEPFESSKMRPNHQEVSKIIVCTLAELSQDNNQSFTQFGSGYTLPVYFGHHGSTGSKPKIWGLTAIITHLTLSALVPEMYHLKLPFIPKIGQVKKSRLE